MMRNKTMTKTRTFQLHKSPSMEAPTHFKPTTTFVPDKSPHRIEFPTSPQLILGEERLHFSHPQHPLSQVILPDRFTCEGCKEYGAGLRYSCQQCQFQLHEFCVLAPTDFKGHPFHCQHQVVFYSKPAAGGGAKVKCDICGQPSKGYAYRCSACGFQMHPCCAMLPSEMNYASVHPHTIKLLAATAIPNGDAGFACGECDRKRSGRVYRCTVCPNYHLHAVCAKDMVNGLRANGIKPEKPSRLGKTARFATRVVKDFLGGLIEGVAEGIGEAIIQNVVKDHAVDRNN